MAILPVPLPVTHTQIVRYANHSLQDVARHSGYNVSKMTWRVRRCKTLNRTEGTCLFKIVLVIGTADGTCRGRIFVRRLGKKVDYRFAGVHCGKV